ncbi:MAG: hypothetical protein OEY05_12395 [Paracoccaceae bacterium]|nr:hypothetical protein [Paracoccaceae bacterium]
MSMQRNYGVLRASLPLSDSMNATFSLQGADYPVNWRFDFIVAITTLRVVGHVLHKVDCLMFPVIKPEVEARFLRWKRGQGDDVLFTDFIEESRNTLLKTYSFPSADTTAFDEDEFGCFIDEEMHPDVVQRGPFKGENVIGLLQHSHRWWQSELSDIAGFVPNLVEELR